MHHLKVGETQCVTETIIGKMSDFVAMLKNHKERSLDCRSPPDDYSSVLPNFDFKVYKQPVFVGFKRKF